MNQISNEFIIQTSPVKEVVNIDINSIHIDSQMLQMFGIKKIGLHNDDHISNNNKSDNDNANANENENETDENQ